METPDELLERLDRMGEERVHQLIKKRYFEAKKLPVVQGWLQQKQLEREGPKRPVADPEEALKKVRAQAREASESALKAEVSAQLAAEAARSTHRMSLIAIGVGAAGLVISVLALFALALG